MKYSGVGVAVAVGNIKVGVPVVANAAAGLAETNIMVPLGPWVKMGRFG